MMMKFYLHYLIYEYYFTCSLFWTAHRLINDKQDIWFLREIYTFKTFQRISFQLPSPPNVEDWQLMIKHPDEDFCKVV